MQRKTARFKRVLVLTERFNIPANDFDAKKKFAHRDRVFFPTELVASETQCNCY